MECKKCYSGVGAVLTAIGFLTGFIAYILFFTTYAEHVIPKSYPHKARLFEWDNDLCKYCKSHSVSVLVLLLHDHHSIELGFSTGIRICPDRKLQY